MNIGLWYHEKSSFKRKGKQGMITHAYNPNTWETKAGGLL